MIERIIITSTTLIIFFLFIGTYVAIKSLLENVPKHKIEDERDELEPRHESTHYTHIPILKSRNVTYNTQRLPTKDSHRNKQAYSTLTYNGSGMTNRYDNGYTNQTQFKRMNFDNSVRTNKTPT